MGKSPNEVGPTAAELAAENAALKAQLAAANKAKITVGDTPSITVKDNGSLAVYGIGGRFPCQLHPDQWRKVFGMREQIEAALTEHADKLVTVAVAIERSKAKKAATATA